MTDVQVLIIGGGAMGVSLAYHLLAYGEYGDLRITLELAGTISTMETP